MPQFMFSAQDRMGNTVEGTVTATDEMFASDEVRRMGYTPLRLQPAGGPVIEEGPMLPNAAPSAVGGAPSAASTRMSAPTLVQAPGPAPIDLTQPITEMPAAANALLVPVEGEATAQMERLEPWQRGGPVPQPPAPQSLAGTAMHPGATQTMPAVANAVYGAQARSEVARGVERGIPFGPGAERQVSLYQRAKETLIYPIFSGVVIKDLAPFFRQFATLINAGLPLYQALAALESNTQNRKLKEIARLGQAQVQAGGRFSDVMAAHPWIFQTMQVELVRAAELGGMLDQVLLQIADYIEHDLEIRRLISRETIYPKFVLFVALMILGRTGFEGGLPAVSNLVLGSMGKATYTGANYLMDTVVFGLEIAVPILAVVALFRLFLFNIPSVREAYDTFKMAIPGLGKLVRQFATAKFGRTFAALYRGGFAMGTALKIAGDACGNGVIRKAAYSAIPVAERGGLVSEALQRSGAFAPIAVDMFRTGETTGNLDGMLDKMADFNENEAKSKSHMIAVAFGVGIFLIVALLVAKSIVTQWMGITNSEMNAANGQ